MEMVVNSYSAPNSTIGPIRKKENKSLSSCIFSYGTQASAPKPDLLPGTAPSFAGSRLRLLSHIMTVSVQIRQLFPMHRDRYVGATPSSGTISR